MKTETTRRGLLAGMGAACLAGGAAVAETNPDADLIALGRELRAAWKVELAAYDDMADDGGREYIARTKESKKAVERVINTPAMTPEGMSVKVLALMWCRGISAPEEEDPTTTTDNRVLWSMGRDFLRAEGAHA